MIHTTGTNKRTYKGTYKGT